MIEVWTSVSVALLSAAVALFTVGWQNRAARRGARDDAKRAAYSRLLAASMSMGFAAKTMHVAIGHRSGLAEGVGVTFGTRTEADPLTIHDFLRPDFDALAQAWSAIWVFGSPPGVTAANRLMTRSLELMEAHTQRGQRNRRGRRVVLGEAWTDEQRGQMDTTVRALAVARKDFAELARRELQSGGAALFSDD